MITRYLKFIFFIVLALTCLITDVVAEEDDSSVAGKVVDSVKFVGEKTGKGIKAVGKGVQKLGGETLEVSKKVKENTFDPLIISDSRLPTEETKLSDAVANTTVITREDIDKMGARTVQEAMSLSEGVVEFDQVGNFVDTTFDLRGFSGGEDVVFVLDGVRINEPDGNVANLSLINIDEVERIEIVRGSSSALYGSGAFGGVVNIITRQPSEKKVSSFGGYEYSSFDGHEFGGGISGSIPDAITGLDGKLVYYFDGYRKLNDGFRDYGEIRYTSFNGKLGYELPDDSGKVMLGIKYVDDALSNPGALTIQEYHDDISRTMNPLDGRSFDNLIMQIDAEKKFFGDHIHISGNAFRRLNDMTFFTTSRTFADWPTGFTPDTDRITNKITTKGFTAQVSYNEEYKIVKNKLTAGIEYNNNSQTDDEIHSPFGVPSDILETWRNTDLDSTGIFVQDTLNIDDRLILKYGIRHDDYDLKYHNMLNPLTNATNSFDDTTSTVGFVFRPVTYCDIYGNFSEAFKAPNISDLFAFAGAGSNPGLEPEEANSYEIGLRLRYKDICSLNCDFFYIDLKNEIMFDASAITPLNPFGQNVNAGKSRRHGFELSLKNKWLDNLETLFTYTYTVAKVRSSLAGTINFSGDPIGLVPENRFTAAINYEPIKNLRFHLNGIFVGRQHSQGFPTLTNPARAADSIIEPYYVFNAKVSYTWRYFELYYQINNILDRDYYTRSVTAGGPFSLFGRWETFVNPAPPREMRVGMKYDF